MLNLRGDLVVEMSFDGETWVDVTDRLLSRELTITYGEADEQAVAAPMSVQFTLDNTSGDFTPEHPGSQYYPHIIKGVLVRIRVGAHQRLIGEVIEWLPSWPYGDLSTQDDPGVAVTEVTVAGILQRIGNEDAPLNSAPYRMIVDSGPVAYWPLAEGDATEVGWPVVGSHPLQHVAGDRPEWGQGELADWLPPALKLGGDSSPPALVRGRVSMTDTRWTVGVALRLYSGTWRLECIGGTGPGGDQVTLTFQYNSGVVEIYRTYVDSSDTSSQTFVDAVAVPELADGNVHHVAVYHAMTDTVHTTVLSVDGQDRAGYIHSSGTPAPLYAVTIRSSVGGSVAVGHLAVWGRDAPELSDVAAAVYGYRGETAGRRIERLCTEEGIPFTAIGDLDDTTRLGPQHVRALYNLLTEAATADAGILFEQLDAFGLGYRTRASMYNQKPAMVLDAGTWPGQINAPFQPVLDDQRLTNDLTLQQPGGRSVRMEVTEGPRSTLQPPHGAGPKRRQAELHVERDEPLVDHVGWRLRLGTWPGMRYPSVSPAIDHYPELAEQWTRLRVGDRIQVTGLPPQHPSDTVDLIARGWSETLRPHSWVPVVNAAPAGPYTVGRWVDESHVRLSTHGDRAGTPHSASHDVSGDLDLRLDWAPDPLGEDEALGDLLVVHYGEDGDRDFVLLRTWEGELLFVWYPDGTTATQTLALSPNLGLNANPSKRRAVRVTLTLDYQGTGRYRVDWYTAPTIDGPWLHVGHEDGDTTTVLHGSTEPLMVGAASDGDALFPGHTTGRGKFYTMELRDGIDGTLVASPDWRTYTGVGDTITDAQGNVWSVAGESARLVHETTSPADPIRFDTAGTITEAPFTPGTDTELVVRTFAGPPWTSDPADLPFDIRVHGARLRVTAVTTLPPDTAVSDTFDRTVATGWGVADTGHAWHVAGSGTLSVTPGIASMVTDDHVRALVDMPSADVEVLTSFRANGGLGGVILRGSLSTPDRYEVTYDDEGFVYVFRYIAGSGYTLVGSWSQGPAFVPGAWYMMRAQILGSVIRARVWADGDTEPDTWMASGVDRTLTSGYPGAWCEVWFWTAVEWDFRTFQVTPLSTEVRQEFTVEPSAVNGVTRTVPAGSPVSLWTPAVYAL